MTGRGVHDIGGLPAGPIETKEHEPSLTERRIDAMMMLLRQSTATAFTTDENRRSIESLAPAMYERAGYYERWVRSMTSLMVEKGVLSQAEVEARLAAVRARFAGPATGDSP